MSCPLEPDWFCISGSILISFGLTPSWFMSLPNSIIMGAPLSSETMILFSVLQRRMFNSVLGSTTRSGYLKGWFPHTYLSPFSKIGVISPSSCPAPNPSSADWPLCWFSHPAPQQKDYMVWNISRTNLKPHQMLALKIDDLQSFMLFPYPKSLNLLESKIISCSTRQGILWGQKPLFHPSCLPMTPVKCL